MPKPDLSSLLQNAKGLLIDLSGVIYIEDDLLPGAQELVATLDQSRVPYRFTTNTTTASVNTLHKKLIGLGLDVPHEAIYGTTQAAVSWLRQRGSPRCHFLLSDDPRSDFAEFPEDNDSPEMIVIGDSGKSWDWQTMNRLCHMVFKGAQVVALHKGRYWQTSEGLRVDIGALIAGIEYVTQTTATVIGKPSKEFFTQAARSMNLLPTELIMIGDDIESDIGGAQRAGMKGILSLTGKYRKELAERSTVTPDAEIESLTEICEALQTRN